MRWFHTWFGLNLSNLDTYEISSKCLVHKSIIKQWGPYVVHFKCKNSPYIVYSLPTFKHSLLFIRIIRLKMIIVLDTNFCLFSIKSHNHMKYPLFWSKVWVCPNIGFFDPPLTLPHPPPLFLPIPTPPDSIS